MIIVVVVIDFSVVLVSMSIHLRQPLRASSPYLMIIIIMMWVTDGQLSYIDRFRGRANQPTNLPSTGSGSCVALLSIFYLLILDIVCYCGNSPEGMSRFVYYHHHRPPDRSFVRRSLWPLLLPSWLCLLRMLYDRPLITLA